MRPANSSTPSGMRRRPIGADEIQQRAQRIQHELGEHAPRRATRCRSAKIADAVARAPSTTQANSSGSPTLKHDASSDSIRSDWGAAGRRAPRERRPPRRPGTARTPTRAGAPAIYATARCPKMLLQVAASFDSVIMVSNCTRGSTPCLSRFGSIGASQLPRWRAPWSRTPRSAWTRNFCANGPSFPSCACCSWPRAVRCGALTPCARQPRAPLSGRSPRAASRKVIHSARQDLEAFYLNAKRVISPVFDTQIAAGCVGLKPQIGYAELVKTLLDVNLPKGQTRTDWSKRPLTREQLEYATDDVLYLERDRRSADRTAARPWGASMGFGGLPHARGCALYEPDPARAWKRGCAVSSSCRRRRAHARGALAVWRERVARERDLPRGWIISDAAIFEVADANPERARPSPRCARAAAHECRHRRRIARGAARERSSVSPTDQEPVQECAADPRSNGRSSTGSPAVDARAAELGVERRDSRAARRTEGARDG